MRPFKRLILFSIILAGISCQEDNSLTPDPTNLSKPAREYLQMISIPGTYGMPVPGVPFNGALRRLFSPIDRSTRRVQDSVASLPWATCATTNTSANPDGSVTTEVNYGDGCEEGFDTYKYFMHGKYAYTESSDLNEAGPIVTESFKFSYLSDNYGGSYFNGTDDVEWLSNWEGSTTGTTSRNKSGDVFWGSCTTNHEGESVFNGEVRTYTGSTRISYTHKTSTIEESSGTLRSGDNYFHSVVLGPLMMRYDCSPWFSMYPSVSSATWHHVPIYVSGREFVRYKQDGQEGSFTIFWGNGMCDSKLEVEENGVYYKLDWTNMQELFYQ